jgi:predicted NBD/HSP70 family sugar kinase
MAKTIGVTLSEKVIAGLVVDHKVVGPLGCFPEDRDDDGAMIEMPTDDLVRMLCDQVVCAANGNTDVTAVGVALPGLIRNGVVEDSPNLQQLKGARIQEMLSAKLAERGMHVSVNAVNDADGMATGLAATQGKLDRVIRVWTLGIGIGFGRYPFTEGWFEGGHTTVSLDDKERYCGCGGRGHMEGIMGHRAMRLRFLDMEPDEIFEGAKAGVQRCVEFKRLWHKALAAGTANSIHFDGTGKFFLTGPNVKFVDLSMLRDYLQQMVKMSPLQSYSVEVVTDDAETRVIGAAVTAEQAAKRA